MVDRIYIAANCRDTRFTRICIASVRMFYPDVEIRILRGGYISPGILYEFEKFWGARPADFPVGDYGWGFVKLEPLFKPSSERFLVLDSDTIITGPVLDLWRDCNDSFLVDDEEQSESDTKRLYYDWQRVREVEPQTTKPQFVFNSGQWFGTSGVISREDFELWVNWGMPRTLKHPGLFMPGDQGVLNYVLNQGVACKKFNVGRCKLMRWPGHGLQGLSSIDIKSGNGSGCVVHWAGVKSNYHSEMVGSDLLAYFESRYFERLPGGAYHKWAAITTDVAAHMIHDIHQNARLAIRKRFCSFGENADGSSN